MSIFGLFALVLRWRWALGLHTFNCLLGCIFFIGFAIACTYAVKILTQSIDSQSDKWCKPITRQQLEFGLTQKYHDEYCKLLSKATDYLLEKGVDHYIPSAKKLVESERRLDDLSYNNNYSNEGALLIKINPFANSANSKESERRRVLAATETFKLPNGKTVMCDGDCQRRLELIYRLGGCATLEKVCSVSKKYKNFSPVAKYLLMKFFTTI